MSASIGLSAASEKSSEFPAFSTGRENAFCLRHVGDARHIGDGGYSPCLFGYVTMWVGASQSDVCQPIRTSVSETKEAMYRPMHGASWDEEQTSGSRMSRSHGMIWPGELSEWTCFCRTVWFVELAYRACVSHAHNLDVNSYAVNQREYRTFDVIKSIAIECVPAQQGVYKVSTILSAVMDSLNSKTIEQRRSDSGRRFGDECECNTGPDLDPN